MGSKEKHVLVLRCFAYPVNNAGKNGYFAACIDLDLYTWRSTHSEAKRSLMAAIEGYLHTVSDLTKEENLSWEEMRNRILRPAPFFPIRARYYYHRLLHYLVKDDRSTYKEPVSVPNAHATA